MKTSQAKGAQLSSDDVQKIRHFVRDAAHRSGGPTHSLIVLTRDAVVRGLSKRYNADVDIVEGELERVLDAKKSNSKRVAPAVVKLVADALERRGLTPIDV